MEKSLVKDNEIEKIEFPWLIFKLQNEYYTFSSRLVCTIMTFPKDVISMPKAPMHIRGVFELRGEIIPLIDLRILFGIKSLMKEYDEFVEMLEKRKQEHIFWVKELKDSVKEKRPFTLATDPHKCEFGKWYYNFQSDSYSIKHHLQKIKEPHRKLHHAAVEVYDCQQNCKECEREECLKNIFERLSGEYVPQILSLLEEIKEAFKDDYREMAVILQKDEQKFGIIADEIVSVENLETISTKMTTESFHASKFISGVKKSMTIQRDIMEIDEIVLINTINGSIPLPQ